jgi:hypothetical protein
MSSRVVRPAKLRGLRALVVATLVLLAVQGQLGDSVTIFVIPPKPVAAPPQTPAGLLGALQALPASFVPIWHAFQGVVLVLLAVAVLALALAWSRSRGVRIWAALGLVCMVVAALGGYEFVRSGFADNGSSAQMGAMFIAAFASYFLVLYYTK